MTERRRSICIVATVPFAIRFFMRAHVRRLSRDYDITLVSNGTEADVAELLSPSVRFVPMRIERKIDLLVDGRALMALRSFFRRERFDAVHSITPKAGLLAMLGARLAGVPVRPHLSGQCADANRQGFMRWFLRELDRVMIRSATHAFPDGHSQRNYLIETGTVRPDEVTVLADGSVGGVDLSRFKPDGAARDRIRREHGIPADAPTFLYLGRLSEEKGALELLRAWPSVSSRAPNAHLLVVGPDEGNLDSEFSALAAQSSGRVHRVGGFCDVPEEFMAASDVICLPSHREGFGMVLAEAAATGAPSIASRIYGVQDIVIDGETGLLFTLRDPAALAEAMVDLASHPERRRAMGEAARQRVVDRFAEERLTSALAEVYRQAFAAL